ncbi:MAG: thiolase family protein [Verrucomicrobiales bacterium]|nr:thiolase family protein [Verrucomicrobiales bacterium]
MKRLCILDGCRTPFARVGTTLAEWSAVDLGRQVSQGLLTRTGLDPELIDETIFGCVGQPADAQNIARVIALRAGIPQSKPALTVHRNCASGLEAVLDAHCRIQAERGSIYLVGGTESMSSMPFYFPTSIAPKLSHLMRAKHPGPRLHAAAAFRPADFAPIPGLKLGLTDPYTALNMGQTAEILAREYNISRQAQDAWAACSHRRAAAASSTLHAEEVLPLFTPDGQVIREDNGIRTDSTPERLARLKPVFDPRYGSVTAGNSSQITDGAVALIVGSEEAAAQFGWSPLGWLVDSVTVGCDPARMGLGPALAIDALLHRHRLSLDDIDIIEINEAFAAQVLAVLRALSDPIAARRAGLESPLGEIEPSRLNAAGGAIALGHPVGATGARLVLTALRQLRARGGGRALVSLCIGGGQGVAALLEST